ncbi:hypothetical protein E3O45_06035 [Cryobacterium sp. TMS1-20-1]|nr:hypothetical protein E3O45_06035 [Cryobacterium sp. TMS1-20-1]
MYITNRQNDPPSGVVKLVGSRQVLCRDEGEIDAYWANLSHVPDSEQCGWCKDRFGISWQIIPENMADLTRRPEQIGVMMGQKKIVIEELENA